ncbi:neutral zinc metallopeptidase [Herbidospora daliensis]|uniref:neutral zinc metallopeptidase n=1 Tax=Herbidospora daliensis TaxID=295585 RepID=UPI0018DB067C|nr:neutral zinc metallopeptidase [Herbidospora daliensis]
MRRSSITGLLVALVLTAAPVPAHAAPALDPVLVDNPLYDSGVIARSACVERPISRRGDAAAAKKYVAAVVKCLNRVWTAQFAKAGLTFEKPQMVLLTKDPKKACGHPWSPDQFRRYCPEEGRIVVVLDRTLLGRQVGDLYVFTMLAEAYAWHITRITGISEAAGDLAGLQYSRRLALQHMCLAGAFVGSVHRSMRHRDARDWRFVVSRYQHQEAGIFSGNRENIAFWMNRGFTKRNVAACSTWTYSESKVE